MRIGLLAASIVTLGACATADSSRNAPTPDASTGGPIVDAPDRGQPDAETPCVDTTTQLLKNASFDETPAGAGWTGTPVDPQFPLVTSDGDGTNLGIAEHTPTMDAWMGGFATANANDQLYQDVVIPDRTSMLVLTGMHDIRSGETGGVKDTAEVALVKPDGTPIEVALATDNTQPKTAWTAFDHTFSATGLSGQTVRLRLKTHNDATADTETSFYFDTFALVATHCQ